MYVDIFLTPYLSLCLHLVLYLYTYIKLTFLIIMVKSQPTQPLKIVTQLGWTLLHSYMEACGEVCITYILPRRTMCVNSYHYLKFS